MRERLADEVPRIRVGDVSDFENYMGAVIDSASFTTQAEAIDEARTSGAEIVAAGEVDDSEGWFVRPTVIRTEDPQFRLLRDELRPGGDDVRLRPGAGARRPSRRRDVTAGLTGAVFARDRTAILDAHDELGHAAGTSTSTTSRLAPSSASSRSAARELGERQGRVV